jgi:CheY-like chemotaxis protein/HPt (histidine-containing phosphotransfer) domain-containing protein
VTRDEEIAAALRPTFAREARMLAEQIEHAADTGSREELRQLAHRLVGSAGTVREKAIVEASRELELLAGDASVHERVVVERARGVRAAVGLLVEQIGVGAAAADAESGGGVPVVVAIEDSSANVALLHRIFDDVDGVELVTAQSGREGARLARERAAALVLLDLNLPDVSGEWVLDALRGDDGEPVPKVVVLSADATPGLEEQARRLGASDYIAKPFDIAHLRAVVRKACLT